MTKYTLKTPTTGQRLAKYKQQYGLIILCENEADQIAKFQDLKKAGYKLRVVVT